MTDEPTGGRPQVAVLGGGVMGETLLSALLTAGWAPSRSRSPSGTSRGPTSSPAGTACAPARRTPRRPPAPTSCSWRSSRTSSPRCSTRCRRPCAAASSSSASPPGCRSPATRSGCPRAARRPRHAEHAGGRRQGRQRDRAGTHATEGHLVLVETHARRHRARGPGGGEGPRRRHRDLRVRAGVRVLPHRRDGRGGRPARAEPGPGDEARRGHRRGSAALAAQSGDHPAVLRERVSSPGGTTVAAVQVLDAHGVRAGVVAAAEAARNRSRELGQQ